MQINKLELLAALSEIAVLVSYIFTMAQAGAIVAAIVNVHAECVTDKKEGDVDGLTGLRRTNPGMICFLCMGA